MFWNKKKQEVVKDRTVTATFTDSGLTLGLNNVKTNELATLGAILSYKAGRIAEENETQQY